MGVTLGTMLCETAVFTFLRCTEGLVAHNSRGCGLCIQNTVLHEPRKFHILLEGRRSFPDPC